MTDGTGLPLAVTLTPGQRHQATALGPTLKAVRRPGHRGRPRARPKYLAGDKAHSSRPVLAYLRRRRIQPVIPPRQGGNRGQGCPRALDRDLHGRRNALERCAGRLKVCRSIAPRHDPLAITSATLVTLALPHQCLRPLIPPTEGRSRLKL